MMINGKTPGSFVGCWICNPHGSAKGKTKKKQKRQVRSIEKRRWKGEWYV